ncbi:hypothetical protein NPIL_382371 [Nephila pilipes]|uniref:Uncharacterized protein n=1 Tax=Nephila pilipes TaxID=299642 RepID=A0A8X6UHH6_NEPPI|nr:hypothetical protein NPIL_382371 [Nephila pilipes]
MSKLPIASLTEIHNEEEVVIITQFRSDSCDSRAKSCTKIDNSLGDLFILDLELQDRFCEYSSMITNSNEVTLTANYSVIR